MNDPPPPAADNLLCEVLTAGYKFGSKLGLNLMSLHFMRRVVNFARGPPHFSDRVSPPQRRSKRQQA